MWLFGQWLADGGFLGHLLHLTQMLRARSLDSIAYLLANVLANCGFLCTIACSTIAACMCALA
jgi:hypothetical protein